MQEEDTESGGRCRDGEWESDREREIYIYIYIYIKDLFERELDGLV